MDVQCKKSHLWTPGRCMVQAALQCTCRQARAEQAAEAESGAGWTGEMEFVLLSRTEG